MTTVSNISRLPQVVPIVFENGRRTSVNIMPKSRVELPPKSKVDPNWFALNPGCVAVLTPKVTPGESQKKHTREVVTKESQ